MKPILEIEKDLYNDRDFTVPVFEEQSYQLAGIETIEILETFSRKATVLHIQTLSDNCGSWASYLQGVT